MNTFPLALSQKLEGEGGKTLGWVVGWLLILGCEVASLSGPPDRILFPWPRVARRDEPPM